MYKERVFNKTNKIKALLKKNPEQTQILLRKDNFLDVLDENRTAVIDNIRADAKGVYQFSVILNLSPELREVFFTVKN